MGQDDVHYNVVLNWLFMDLVGFGASQDDAECHTDSCEHILDQILQTDSYAECHTDFTIFH